MDLRAYIGTLTGSLVVALVLAVVTAAVCELINGVVIRAIAKKPWWPTAEPLQKAFMVNFGYPEETCTTEVLQESFAFVLLICGHHFLMGLLMIPVIVHGWSGAGPLGQLLFLMAALGDVGFDVYDWIKKFLLVILPSKCRCLGPPCPLPFFIIICCLHHTLAMLLVIPMNLKYYYLAEYQKIAFSLLMAAGICFLSGQYKFTLNVQAKGEFMQYKAIVVIQFVTIWYTRCFVWFPNLLSALRIFHGSSDWLFFISGCVGGALMSLFNVIMLLDATAAAIKWLPKPLPATQEHREELQKAIARQQSALMLQLPAELGGGARKMRMNVKVAVAAQRFKAPVLPGKEQ